MNRELLAQTFSVLIFLPLVFIVVVAVRFFSQVAQGEKPRVSEMQGLVWLACAWFGLVVGVALLILVVLDRVMDLLPVGVGIIVVALFIALRSMQLLRTRSGARAYARTNGRPPEPFVVTREFWRQSAEPSHKRLKNHVSPCAWV